MKVPFSWLKDYVEFDASPGDLAEKLTFSGIEVEGIEEVGSDFAGVVVGEVLSLEPHPGADRLRLCRVYDGTTETRVVCGAGNFEAGDKAPFAPVGCILPNGMKIKRAKIRGEESFGMLCAEDELGVSNDHEGIMILPRDVAAGTPLSAVLGPPETVLELEITWNRADCLCMLGIAREVAALYGSTLRKPSVAYPEDGEPVEQFVRVRIDDETFCPRYTARVLNGVNIGPSPLWMQRKLVLAGVRPISNVVDITNYVLLECGHPLHAFDHRLVTGGQIVVRHARDGETMATLDGTERQLTADMLVIADAERPVALAGIMGGAGSEIQDDTRTVLLESACFSAPGIHATSVALGLGTESSHRFERGVDRLNADWASRRATALMVELAGATASRGVVDCFPGRQAPRSVACRFDRVRGRMGVPIADDEIARILESLELPVTERDGDRCVVQVPSFRLDLDIEADLIEEIARMHGLSDVPETVPVALVVPEADDLETRACAKLRSALVGLGLTEAVQYSFVSAPLLDLFGIEKVAERVVLPHPVSSDYAVMRSTLVPQMVETLGRNLARQVGDAALFELGTTYRLDAAGAVVEEQRLCVGLMGKAGRTGINRRSAPMNEEAFLWLKGILEAVLESQHAAGATFERDDSSCFEPGWGAAVCIGGEEPCGFLGLISPDIRHKWRMQECVGIMEVAVPPLVRNAFSEVALRPVPAYPSVSRDIAMVVGHDVRHADIENVIWSAAPKELTAVRLFDIYSDKRLGESKRSLAYSLLYRSAERTLTDDEANRLHEAIKDTLRKELGAEIREN